jgi:2'-5' RNA ligase
MTGVPGQLMFDGADFGPKLRSAASRRLPQSQPDRLFFAIRPSETDAQRIEELTQDLRRRYGLSGPSIGIARFHISLYSVFSGGGEPVAPIIATAGSVASRIAIPSFAFRFDRVASFRGGAEKWPVVLYGGDSVDAVAALQEAVRAAMHDVGLACLPQRRAAPHLTLLYDQKTLAEEAVEAIGFPVREFVLIRSLQGRARHVQLARFPLDL